MEKTKLARATDNIVRAVAIWLLSAIIIRYFIKELYILLSLATVITAVLTLIISKLTRKKKINAQKLKKSAEVMNELIVTDATDFALKLSFALGGENLGDAVVTQNTLFYPFFCGKLGLDKLNYAYNLALARKKKLIILCSATTSDVEKNLNLFSEIPVAVLTQNKTYDFLCEHNLVPEIKKRPKKKISLSRTAFSRSKIKGYLFTALVLLVTAAFSPYSLVCVVIAAFNIAMSIMCEATGY